jgi:hypothetical protein
LKFDDFKELKIECLAICDNVEIELNANASKLKLLREQLKVGARTINEIFYNYLNLDVVDKKYIVSVIPPTTTNITTGAISIHINSVLAKILSFKKLTAMIEVANLDSRLYSYKERTVPIKQAISVIVRNGIQLDENEAGVILDFLYRMAKTYNFTNASNNKIPKWISNRQKMEQKIS